MENFEHIDDYLANRLGQADKQAFEQQLEGNPELREEVEFQRQLIEGVRRARALEIKGMLNNVPVGGAGWSGGQIAAAVISAGVVVTSLYFFLNADTPTAPDVSTKTTDVITTPVIQADSLTDNGVNTNEQKEIIPEESKAKAKVASATRNKTNEASAVRKPRIEVLDPSDELSSNEENSPTNATSRMEISTSKMEVVTGLMDRKHDFHYQFSQGKLLLYGPFDKSLYEILEVHGDGHAVFLFYRENYYLLDQGKTQITKLRPITDSDLIKKLKDYRGH